jgi:predicted phosphodiesterase
MRIAVLSDIHGNLEAFTQVLADIKKAGVDAMVCLGDNIGYGPDPEAVIQLLRKEDIPSVMGNHDLALADDAYLAWFNQLAQKSLALTRVCLSQESIDYCSALPMTRVVEGCLCVHGCPPDSAMTYIFEPSHYELGLIMDSLDQDICFIGHTHLLELYHYDGREIHQSPLGEEKIRLNHTDRYLVNVGSVGQPRDADRQAKYVIYNVRERFLEVRFVPYDIAKTASKILEQGWPEYHARRLW